MTTYIHMIFDCLFLYVYFATPFFIVTLLHYVSNELKELPTYLLTYLLLRDKLYMFSAKYC